MYNPNSAIERVKNHLAYKLGQAMIDFTNNGGFLLYSYDDVADNPGSVTRWAYIRVDTTISHSH
ncbi:hypothetical protein, partial [Campylobacter jejuni]|uniref:hypothetical protein n=1 Tax=Campylobacter jejuni TaxID=197 RepID=UPI000A8E66A0